MNYYVQTSAARKDGTRDSFATIAVDHKDAPLWWHERGLQQTASGYGSRITTRTMIKFNGKWRRVYCCIYSNIGTLYIGKLSDGLTVSAA
jgi:hypothetical protein